MTREHLQRFADAIVRHYTPADKDSVRHDIRHKTFSRKLEELRHMVITFTDDVDIREKEEIANCAAQQLINAYKLV